MLYWVYCYTVCLVCVTYSMSLRAMAFRCVLCPLKNRSSIPCPSLHIDQQKAPVSPHTTITSVPCQYRVNFIVFIYWCILGYVGVDKVVDRPFSGPRPVSILHRYPPYISVSLHPQLPYPWCLFINHLHLADSSHPFGSHSSLITVSSPLIPRTRFPRSRRQGYVHRLLRLSPDPLWTICHASALPTNQRIAPHKMHNILSGLQGVTASDIRLRLGLNWYYSLTLSIYQLISSMHSIPLNAYTIKSYSSYLLWRKSG